MPYPPAPSRRMAWDADGTVALVRWADDEVVYTPQNELSAADATDLNDEDNVNVQAFSGALGHIRAWYTLIFPELREFDGFFARGSVTSRITRVETSGDTTNGIDGTWITEDADYSDPGIDVYAAYRTVTSFARSSRRGLRVDHDNVVTSRAYMRGLHVYGDITPGQTPDRLLFIDEATGLEFTAPVDFGDVPRGSSEDSLWRIKNNSATLTANTIQYAAEALYLASAAWYTHTLPGGGTFQGTRQVASLAPATTSGLITTRRITPAAEVLGLHAARVYLNVDTWT